MASGGPFYHLKKKASEASLSSSASSRSSSAASSSSSGREASQKRFLHEARRASKALTHGSGEGAAAGSKSRSVRALLEATRKLYELKVGEARLVPDTQDFNKLLMLVIAEVADNTHSAYMRSYPTPAGAAGLLEEKLVSKKKFPKGSVQAKVAGSGIAALQRCATKYLETGGGRFLSALDMSSKKSRRRPPGKTLLLVFKDFHLYDTGLRKTQRHLPAASLHGVVFHRDAEVYQCGVLRRHQRLASAPTVSKEKIEELRKRVKEIFKLAKQVGASLARCVAPRASDEGFKAVSKEEIEEALGGPGGLITNLRKVSFFLAGAERTSREERSLAKFLHEAVGELLEVAGRACEAHLGKGVCHKSLASALASPSGHTASSPSGTPSSSPATSRASSPARSSSGSNTSLLSKASPKSSSGSPRLSPSFLSKFPSLKAQNSAGKKDASSSLSSSSSPSSSASSSKLSPSFLSKFLGLKAKRYPKKMDSGSVSPGTSSRSSRSLGSSALPSESSSLGTPKEPVTPSRSSSASSSSSSSSSSLLEKKQQEKSPEKRGGAPPGTPLKTWPVSQVALSPVRL